MLVAIDIDPQEADIELGVTFQPALVALIFNRKTMRSYERVIQEHIKGPVLGLRVAYPLREREEDRETLPPHGHHLFVGRRGQNADVVSM